MNYVTRFPSLHFRSQQGHRLIFLQTTLPNFIFPADCTTRGSCCVLSFTFFSKTNKTERKSETQKNCLQIFFYEFLSSYRTAIYRFAVNDILNSTNEHARQDYFIYSFLPSFSWAQRHHTDKFTSARREQNEKPFYRKTRVAWLGLNRASWLS